MVFKDREFGKNVHDLERTANPFLHPFVDGEMGDVFITEKDLSRIGRDISGEQIDQSGFARSVGSDDRSQHPFVNLKVNIICCAHHTKIFSKFLRPEKFRHAKNPSG